MCDNIMYSDPYFFHSYFNESIDSFTNKDLKQKIVFNPKYRVVGGFALIITTKLSRSPV